jgi:hypothetical protein
MKIVKRESKFIEDDSGNIYLPRPSGWLSGWMRHIWFKSLMGTKPCIASPEYWAILNKKFTVKCLVEYQDGSHKILEKMF